MDEQLENVGIIRCKGDFTVILIAVKEKKRR